MYSITAVSTHYYIHAGGGPARGEAVLAVLPRGAAGDQHRGGGRQAEVRLQHLRRLRDRGHEQEQGPGGDQHPQQPMILISVQLFCVISFFLIKAQITDSPYYDLYVGDPV